MKDDFNKITRTVDEERAVSYRTKKEGWLHREDGPAIERADGTKEWWLYGVIHREDGPAYEGADGTTAWFLKGQPWPEGQRAAEKKIADAAGRRRRDIESCLHGLPYDLDVGKPLQLEEKKQGI